MGECYCLRCHSPMQVVAVVYDRAAAFICPRCSFVWQINLGWNRWLNSFDSELIRPRYV